MENINILLDKYFRAETTIVQEQQLKSYLNSQNVLPEHIQYKVLFETFRVEAQQKRPVQKMNPNRNNSKPIFWWSGLSVSGIAASLIIGFWFFSVDVSADYAFVHGQKVDNQTEVHQLANEKLLQINGFINRTMQPVEEFQNVKANLKPLRETGSKLNSIRNNNKEN